MSGLQPVRAAGEVDGSPLGHANQFILPAKPYSQAPPPPKFPCLQFLPAPEGVVFSPLIIPQNQQQSTKNRVADYQHIARISPNTLWIHKEK